MAENLDHQPQTNIQLDLTKEVAEGSYTNLVISNYSSEEFILDFAFLQPQTSKALVKNRIVLSPRNAKKMVALLSRQLEEYESKFGSISDENPGAVIPFSFN